MHQISGRQGLGITLALVTTIMWAVLPIALNLVLKELDPYTVCWFRFSISALVVGSYIVWKGDLSEVKTAFSSKTLLSFLTVMGLLGNYLFYNFSLQHLNPETAQLIIQIAPFLLMLGGVLMFKEPFTRKQKLGALLVVGGLLTFFNNKLPLLFNFSSTYSLGVALMIMSAVVWTLYALAQKVLLKRFSSITIMVSIYWICSIALFPFINLERIAEMSVLGFTLLLFCGVNTFIGYGAFSEAMNHIHASQVSAIITVVPVLTFMIMLFLSAIWPLYFQAEILNLFAYLGVLMVVSGSILAAIGQSAKV